MTGCGAETRQARRSVDKRRLEIGGGGRGHVARRVYLSVDPVPGPNSVLLSLHAWETISGAAASHAGGPASDLTRVRTRPYCREKGY